MALGIGSLILVISPIIAAIIGWIPWWGKLSGAMALIGFAPELIDKIHGWIDKAKEKTKEWVDKFIQLESVQKILEDLGIGGEDFAEVWGNIKTKIREIIRDIVGDYDDLEKLLIVDIPIWTWMAWMIIEDWVERIIEKLTGDKDSILGGFQDLAKQLEEKYLSYMKNYIES